LPILLSLFYKGEKGVGGGSDMNLSGFFSIKFVIFWTNNWEFFGFFLSVNPNNFANFLEIFAKFFISKNKRKRNHRWDYYYYLQVCEGIVLFSSIFVM